MKVGFHYFDVGSSFRFRDVFLPFGIRITVACGAFVCYGSFVGVNRQGWDAVCRMRGRPATGAVPAFCAVVPVAVVEDFDFVGVFGGLDHERRLLPVDSGS